MEENLSASLDVESDILQLLLDTLLDDKVNYVLHSDEVIDQPAMMDFLQVSERGVSADFWFANQITGAPDLSEASTSNILYSNANPLPPHPTPGSAVSGRWHFYLEAPFTGFASFYVNANVGAQVAFSMDGEDKNMSGLPNGSWKNQLAISLEAGQLYECVLTVEGVLGDLSLNWQSLGSLIEPIPDRQLIPAQDVLHFQHTYLRFLKSIRLSEGFSLSAEEVEYFSNLNSFQFGGTTAFLNRLPIEEGVNTSTAQAMFRRFCKLLNYNDIKESLAIKDHALVEFWQDPLALNEDGNLKVYGLLPWKKSTFDALQLHFDGINDESDLADMEQLEKIIEAHELLHKTQTSPIDLIAWSIPSPGSDIANSMQLMLRSRYDESAWLDVIQPLHDRVRAGQRDALVAYILHELSKDAATRHIDTPNKLFEYFLIDVEMNPCMKTSRIKQALSSVQLFIYRCLMNLELDIEPSSINAGQWEWMKRYRVWEANRKVFLWPENWLDPSLRSTKSPLFKELEGELLQSDISHDLATTALVNYLEKLDRISQLEITGMCREDEERIHVIGHTAGMSREYYHRMYDGAWSAWEKINLDIEGDPVIPVFWKDRLFVFWLTMVPKGDEEGQMAGKTNNPATFNGPVKRTVEINLNWSEYYNKKWQPKKTSNFDRPLLLKTTGFTSRYLMNFSYFIREEEESLVLAVTHKQEFLGTYTLFNKHSLPLENRADKPTKGSGGKKWWEHAGVLCLCGRVERPDRSILSPQHPRQGDRGSGLSYAFGEVLT